MTGEPLHFDSSGEPVHLQPAPRRADARRNREKVLAAARAAFDEGGETSMAEVARRAGVGMATLYRNFPGRRELLEAVYADKVAAVRDAARTAAERADPGPAFRDWLGEFFAFARTKHGVAEELLAEVRCDAVLDEGRDTVLAAGRPLLAAAQEAGAVRVDLTLEQVLALVIAVAGIRGPDEYVQAVLRTALDGLPGPGRPGGPPARG